MYKILVADDEPIHRRGLANMIRNLRPMYDVYEAKNGLEALEIANTKSIDILITDIKMPGLDGLRLIEQLNTQDKNLKVLILSGYAYFEYAQKAVSLGAFDYLLKPVDKSKMDNMLTRIEKSIQDKIKLNKEKNVLTQKLDKTMPIYLKYQFNKWINGKISIAETPELKEYLGENGSGVVIIVEVDYLEQRDKASIYAKDEPGKLLLHIKECLEKICSELRIDNFFLAQDDACMVVGILKTHKDSVDSQLVSCLEDWITSMQKNHDVTITIGIGNIIDDIYINAQSSYQDAYTALNQNFYLGTGKVIVYKGIKTDDVIDIDFIKYEEKLIGAVRDNNRDLSIKAIEEIFSLILCENNKKYIAPQYFIELMSHISYRVLKEIHYMLCEEEYEDLVYLIRHNITKSKNYKQMKENMVKFINRIFDVHAKTKDNRHKLIINRCCKYIESNYKYDISLKSVAENFYFNPSYFSTFFKEHTGMTFSQYLLKVRLDNAIRLLKNTDRKVYEIAEQIGYNDVKYFIRVFKKQYGLSPEEYRRVKLGG